MSALPASVVGPIVIVRPDGRTIELALVELRLEADRWSSGWDGQLIVPADEAPLVPDELEFELLWFDRYQVRVLVTGRHETDRELRLSFRARGGESFRRRLLSLSSETRHAVPAAAARSGYAPGIEEHADHGVEDLFHGVTEAEFDDPPPAGEDPPAAASPVAPPPEETEFDPPAHAPAGGEWAGSEAPTGLEAPPGGPEEATDVAYAPPDAIEIESAGEAPPTPDIAADVPVDEVLASQDAADFAAVPADLPSDEAPESQDWIEPAPAEPPVGSATDPEPPMSEGGGSQDWIEPTSAEPPAGSAAAPEPPVGEDGSQDWGEAAAREPPFAPDEPGDEASTAEPALPPEAAEHRLASEETETSEAHAATDGDIADEAAIARRVVEVGIPPESLERIWIAAEQAVLVEDRVGQAAVQAVRVAVQGIVAYLEFGGDEATAAALTAQLRDLGSAMASLEQRPHLFALGTLIAGEIEAQRPAG